MEKEFILKLAQKRAEELFTTNFFHHVTDSWYFDEKLRFEHSRVDLENSHPTKDDVDIYMKYLDDLFREYENKLYSYELAQNCYGTCINHFTKIFKIIDYGNKTCSQFNIDEDTIKKLKELANIFVYKHNEFCEQISS